MLESKFQSALIKEINERLPGSIVLKNDPNYIQGFPDLLILFDNQWAALEVKQSPNSSLRPNQLWWINRLAQMSYSSFIHPENKEKVLNDLQRAFSV